jgi:uncharacterized protein
MHAFLTSSLRCLRQRSRVAIAFAATAATLLGPGSGAQSPAAPTAERSSVARPTESTSKRGLFYEVSSGAGTVYLFGTLHVGKPDFYPLDPQVNRAFAASESVYLEVNLSDTALMQTASELATYHEGASLDRALPPSVMSKVDAAIKRYQLPRETAVRMKPWMLGQTLLLLEATRRGYDPTYATEMHLLGLAAAQRKEVRGLETLEEQLSIFDRLSEAGQQRFLEEILEAIDDPRMDSHLDALVNAWTHADARGLADELARERSEGTPFAREVLPLLIDQRNRTMAERIAAIARSGRTTFVAVGALHLVGPDGITELLKGRGFRVRSR